MEWFASRGALVWAPLGHSRDVDLIAELHDRLLRVQVKTTTQSATTPKGHRRWRAMIATNGGNQSWSGATKTFDPARVDLLFVLVGDGRRWLIPASAIEAQRQIALGGSKFAEYEIEPGRAINPLIYQEAEPPLESPPQAGGAPESGEPGRPVKSVALLEWVRIPPPPSARPSTKDLKLDGGIHAETDADTPLRFQRTQISSKHQITIPSVPFRRAGLRPGDRLHAHADSTGRVVFERLQTPENQTIEE